MLAEGVLPDVVASGMIGQIEAFMFAQERRTLLSTRLVCSLQDRDPESGWYPVLSMPAYRKGV